MRLVSLLGLLTCREERTVNADPSLANANAPDVVLSKVSLASYALGQKVSFGTAAGIEFFREGATAGSFVAWRVASTMTRQNLCWKTERLEGNFSDYFFHSPTVTTFVYQTDTQGLVAGLNYQSAVGAQGRFFGDAGISIVNPKHSLKANSFDWNLDDGVGHFETVATQGTKE
jgi:hypothetical protein